jgi:hypothetical protein
MSNLKMFRLALLLGAGGLFAGVTVSAPAFANNYGEDQGWQFQTPADQAELAVVQDMIQKKQGGEYQAPNYNTFNITTNTSTIQHQNNCSVASTVYGNYGSNAESGNQPSAGGPSLSSTGNSNSSSVSQNSATGLPVNLSSGQTNGGWVSTNYSGNATAVNGSGPVNQVLNSTQTNGGTQTASVTGSTACSGALN